MNMQEVSCNVGEDFDLSTMLEGFPMPKVIVMKDGKEINNSKRFIWELVQETLTLKMKKTSVEDTGEYSLTASNDVGSDTFKVLLKVIGKCLFLIFFFLLIFFGICKAQYFIIFHP